MKRPRITIIIPTFNRADQMYKAVRCALDQSIDDIQINILDNASTDHTQQLACELMREDSRVSYYRHSENVGATLNIIFGIEQVRTAYFCFQMDDDRMSPNMCKRAMDLFDVYPKAGFVAQENEFVNAQGKLITRKNKIPTGIHPPGIGARILVSTGMPGITSIMFRTDISRKIDMFSSSHCYMDDFLALIRIATKYPFVMDSQIGSRVMLHTGAASSKAPLEYYWPHCIERIGLVSESLKQYPEIRTLVTDRLLKRHRHRILYCYISALSSGNNEVAIKSFRIINNNLDFDMLCFILMKSSSLAYSLFPKLTRNVLNYIMQKKYFLYDRFGLLKRFLSKAKI